MTFSLIIFRFICSRKLRKLLCCLELLCSHSKSRYLFHIDRAFANATLFFMSDQKICFIDCFVHFINNRSIRWATSRLFGRVRTRTRSRRLASGPRRWTSQCCTAIRYRVDIADRCLKVGGQSYYNRLAHASTSTSLNNYPHSSTDSYLRGSLCVQRSGCTFRYITPRRSSLLPRGAH